MAARVRDLRPTRRGVAVLAVVAVAFVLGATTGARSLNAVVVPGLVALVAGGVQLVLADEPTIDRTKPAPGFPGEARRVTVDVDSTVPVTVSETVDGGASQTAPGEGSGSGGLSVVGGDDASTASVGHGGSFDYEVTFDRRGEHRLGPATYRRTDSLGLFSTGGEFEGTTTVLVYPALYRIEREHFGTLVSRVLGNERSSFERLREYVPGDSMRDIHWRSSAKRGRDEFIVAEYRSDSDTSTVSIVGESTPETTDAVASTVGSVAAHLHDVGVTVAVTVPDGTCVAHPGDATSFLRLLAVMDSGQVDDESRATADVRVSGTGGEVTVSLADREVPFERLAGGRRLGEVVG